MRAITKRGKADLIVGLGHGDEGKGKIAQFIGGFRKLGIRSQGGSNAGHTVYLKLDEFDLTRRKGEGDARQINTHQVPTTIVYKHTNNVIGPDVWLDAEKLNDEIAYLQAEGFEVNPSRLSISNLASLVLPGHKQEDAQKERAKGALGSTKAGIAFVARDEALHQDIRANTILKENANETLLAAALDGLMLGDMNEDQKKEAQLKAENFVEAAMRLKPYIKNTVAEVRHQLSQGHNAVIEGAQGAGLDRRFGKHPHVTSSSTTALGLLKGAGLSHKDAGTTYGVIKVFPSKVGGGEFPDRITNPAILKIVEGQEGDVDAEYGKTTGRKREIGWLSIPLLRHYIELNGVDELVLTKFDTIAKINTVTSKFCVVVAYQKNDSKIDQIPDALEDLKGYEPVIKEFDLWQDDVSAVSGFDDLPQQAKTLLKFIEESLGIPIGMIGTGARSDQIIVRKDLLNELELQKKVLTI